MFRKLYKKFNQDNHKSKHQLLKIQHRNTDILEKVLQAAELGYLIFQVFQQKSNFLLSSHPDLYRNRNHLALLRKLAKKFHYLKYF